MGTLKEAKTELLVVEAITVNAKVTDLMKEIQEFQEIVSDTWKGNEAVPMVIELEKFKKILKDRRRFITKSLDDFDDNQNDYLK